MILVHEILENSDILESPLEDPGWPRRNFLDQHFVVSRASLLTSKCFVNFINRNTRWNSCCSNSGMIPVCVTAIVRSTSSWTRSTTTTTSGCRTHTSSCMETSKIRSYPFTSLYGSTATARSTILWGTLLFYLFSNACKIPISIQDGPHTVLQLIFSRENYQRR